MITSDSVSGKLVPVYKVVQPLFVFLPLRNHLWPDCSCRYL